MEEKLSLIPYSQQKAFCHMLANNSSLTATTTGHVL